jgi:hypothetical protein
MAMPRSGIKSTAPCGAIQRRDTDHSLSSTHISVLLHAGNEAAEEHSCGTVNGAERPAGVLVEQRQLDGAVRLAALAQE